MKIIWGILLFCILDPTTRQVATEAIQVDYCDLRGSVYIAEYPSQADFLIYEESSEAFAGLLVFETDNSLFADRPGIWYFTDKQAFADFSVYFVESKGQADFSIYFTSFESFAGCNN